MAIPLQQLNARLQKINLEELIRQAVISNDERLIEMNRSQMERGVRSDGDLIQPEYQSMGYAFFKRGQGTKAPMGVPDLKLTGAFHREMVLVVEGDEYEFGSTDEKTGMLTEKYDKIFGLTKENQQEAVRINTEKLGQLFRKAAGI